MFNMTAVIYTNGQLDFNALRYECKEQSWLPILAVKPKDDPDSSGTIYLFHRFQEAREFIRLNLSGEDKKDWIKGVVTLPPEDVQAIWKKHKVEPQYKARKMLTHPTLNLSFEIIDLGGEPDLFVASDSLVKV